MTRIIFQWMLIFIIGGIVLLVSGESTTPTTSEEKTPNSDSPSILSSTENRSSDISSDSVVPETESTREEFVSTISNIELAEASKTAEPLDGNKTQHIVYSDGLSTEILTTSLSTDPSSEASEFTITASSSEVHNGGYDEHQETVSTSKNSLSSGKDSDTGMDIQDAADASDKSLISTSSEISETSTSNDIQSNDPSNRSSKQTEISILSSSDATLVEANTSVDKTEEQTTEAGNADLPLKKSSTQTSSAQSTDAKAADSTLESNTYLDTKTVEMAMNTDETTNEVSTEYSLSLHKTTPKSATKKRSLNNTGDSILHHEITIVPDSFSSTSIRPELFTLLEHGDTSTSESLDGMIMSIKSNISEAIAVNGSYIQDESKNPVEAFSTMSAHSTAPVSVEIQEEKREKLAMLHSNTEYSSLNYPTLSMNEQENMGGKETVITMENESMKPILHSEESVIIPEVSDDYSHLNNLDNVDNAFTGVTFDPNGMKNDEPQDPDSVVFYVPSVNFEKTSTAENEFSSTGYRSSESEREFEFVTHKNSEKEIGDSERMEFIPHDKHINISPEPSHPSMDSSEEVIHETEGDSNSSSSKLVFWNPSNGGWILPGNATDTQIKRMDEALNDESEEMLQDAPHFPDSDSTKSKSPFVNPKTEPKEKYEKKTTFEDGTSSFYKELETETVTELGFMGFSNSFAPHQTDQSVIRPVKINQTTSPDDKSVSTSILPESFSTLAPEQPTGLKLSEPTAGTMTEKIETSSTNTSSPMILPNPAPSVVTDIAKNPELSTIVMQPELVPVSLDKKTHEATETSNSTSDTNSTIAGIAVKTSVSVSLPLSKRNDSQALQPMIEELLKKLNASSLSINGSSIYVVPDSSVPSVSTPSDSSTDGLTITSDQTTTASGFKIRKPKIRIPGSTDAFTPRPIRPFSPNPKKPTTTAGPPVSIFKKQRTRINSITSSTTARPIRPFNGNYNLATVKIQFASDIPGLLPQEFLISTEPVTTTTTEPTTTEEPISEVPFTDQTHIPTVTNEDDVTLVKVAGYVVIDRGLHWNDLLHNRHSPEYKRNAEAMHLYLERMFRSSPISSRLWKIEIDGFSGNKKTRPVGVDFFLYLIKTKEDIPTNDLATAFHEKLSVNNTFGTFRVDTSKTAFEMIQEQPLKAPTPAPEEENVEPPIPQWAIAVIVIGAASLIFIVLFAAVTIYGRHHMRRRYSSKLSEEDMERSSGEWESKMAAAYENMAADTIYDAEDLPSDSYKKGNRIATFHGIPSTLKRCDSWSSNGWTTPPKRKRPHVH